MLVADDAREVDVPEGKVSHEGVARHDHACHPEENDVWARHQIGGGIETLQRWIVGIDCLVSLPAHGGKGPEPGTEPGIQHVRVAVPLAFISRGFEITVNLSGLAVIPDRDLMPPPELAADAPILNVGHPVIVGLGPAVGIKFHVPLSNALMRCFYFGVFEEPLF